MNIRALCVVLLVATPSCMMPGDMDDFQSGVVSQLANTLADANASGEIVTWDGVEDLIKDSAIAVKDVVVARTDTQLQDLSQNGGVMGLAALIGLHFFRNYTRKKEKNGNAT